MKKALLFTGNTPHVAAAHLMTQTLTAPDGGNFDGDIWVLSTDLSETALAYLDALGIQAFVDSMAWADTEMNWRLIFPGQSDAAAKAEFHTYRNKRMSKLIYLDWFEEHGAEYDAVVVCDNDLYFQGDINDLFDLASDGRIRYTPEDNPIFAGTNLWIKDARYRQMTGDWDHESGLHEFNIGFILGQPDAMRGLFAEIRARFPKLPEALIRNHAWHDQDIARIVRARQPDLFTPFPADTILHLCGGGMALVEEGPPGTFRNRLTGALPRIVHFGGGAWRDFKSVAPCYRIDPQDLFDDVLRRPAGDWHLSISSATYNKRSGTLEVTGWFVADQPDFTLHVATSLLGYLGTADLNHPRPDVTARFPGSVEHSGGFRFQKRMPAPKAPDKLVLSAMLNGARRVVSVDITRTEGHNPSSPVE